MTFIINTVLVPSHAKEDHDCGEKQNHLRPAKVRQPEPVEGEFLANEPTQMRIMR